MKKQLLTVAAYVALQFGLSGINTAQAQYTFTMANQTWPGFNFTQMPAGLTGTLTSVSVNVTLNASVSYTYGDDICVYVASDPLALGGLLQVGGFSNLNAAEGWAWPNGASDAPGTTCTGTVTLTTPIVFTGAPSDPVIWIGNGYGAAGTSGTWTGTITLNGISPGATCTAPTLSATTVAALCAGNANGSIDLTTTGGSPTPLIYAWSNGGSTEDLTGLTAGTYTVTVTTQTGGCSATGSYTVADGAANVTYYADADGDTYGNAAVSQTSCTGAPVGYVADNTDCDDNNSSASPVGLEICGNGIDEDCSGSDCTIPGCIDANACNFNASATTDDGSCVYPTLNYFVDFDSDGYGLNDMWSMPNTFCTDPGLGWSLNNLDCDDSNGLIFPGATELCNGLDDDCSGIADDGLTFNEYFADADGDSFGTPALNYVVTPITYQLLTPQVLSSNVTLDLAGRIMSYTGISINGASNTEVVAAGSTVSLAYNLAVTWGPNLYCPGCMTQSYIGIGGSTTTLQCENGIYDGYTNSYNSGTFIAPTTPGTYYLVQNGSLDYLCQPQTYDNTSANAIAILQVEGTLPAAANPGPNCDDCTSQIPIGFSFPFYGNTYSDLAISSNGFVSFDLTVDDGCCFGNVVPGADAVNNMIALGWYDLVPDNGQVTYFNLTNPNRLVIQYSNAPEFFNSGSLSGQIVMFESGLIQLIYSNLTTVTHEATAGVENASGTVGVTISGLNAQIGSLSNVAYEFVYMPSTLNSGISSCTPLVGYALNNTDCLDNNPAINPGATEVCNGIDDNCDTQIDEGLTFTDYFADLDLDGYGAGAATNACAQPTGFVTTNTDCDDNNASANPAATEICNELDDNCDGQIDEGVQNTYYVDMDGDGYGSMNFWSIQACTAPMGFAPSSNDCADENPAINPGATEVCNTIDDNCDGQINEGFGPLTIYYADADGDGYGNGTQTIDVLLQGSSSASVSNGSLVIIGSNTFTGSSLTGSVSFVAPVDATYAFDWSFSTADGAQFDPAYYINGTAYQLTDNFGSQTQSGTQSVTVTAGSTFGFSVVTTDDVQGSATLTISNFNGFSLPTFTQACSQPAGYAVVNGDCDDAVAAINPGATEVCNGIDDNCSGVAEEGLTFTDYYADLDLDGYGAGTATNACAQPVGYVTTNTDCNNNNAAVNPGATELCTTSVDDNCNGLINEGCSTAGENPTNATSMTTSIWPNCNAINGTLVNASASGSAQTICLTGEDKWHQFVATSEGVSIVVNSTSADILIELQTAAGVLVAEENAVSGLGGEILNHYGLTAGQVYKIGVRNYNSALGTGTYSICAKMLKRGGCDYGPGPYTLCQYFKATWAGATGTSYTYTFTGISGPASGNVYTRTQNSDICVLSSVLPTLPYGSTYNVLITNTYTLNNGAGVAETISVPGLAPCSMSTATQPVTALRVSNQCAAGPRFRGAVVASLPWVCGSTNWRWEFTELDAQSQPVGLPITVNRGAASNYINLGSVLQLQYGKTYSVRTAPILPYTGTDYQWGAPVCMSIVGTAGMIADGQDASESTSKVEIANEVNMSLYPNPTHGTDVNINLSGVTSENVQIRVVDAMGRQVWSNRYSVDGVLNTNITFERPLANGLYFVEAIYNGELQTQRMMVQR
jgi:hypothetical protein